MEFGEHRLLTLETLATGQQGSDVRVADYGVQTKWQQLAYKDWVVGEIIVGRFWPRKDALTPAAKAGLWAAA
jgi:hypothetical protein